MGQLIWLMGPSGAGKKTLLAALRQREPAQMLVAHRYVTRPAGVGSENDIVLSEKEFFTRAEHHLFTLSWHANGYYYAIGTEVDLWLQAGFDVVVKGSRGHLAQARAQYASQLLPVSVHVSPAILRERLEKRGRESAAEIAARLERASRYQPKACLTLNNDGSLLQSVEGLVKLICTHQGSSAL